MPDRPVLIYIRDGSHEYYRPIDDAVDKLREVAGDNILVIILNECPWEGTQIDWMSHPYLTRDGMYSLLMELIAKYSCTPV